MGRGLPAFNLRLAVLLFLAVAAFALVACGDDDDDDDDTAEPTATTASGGAAPTTAPTETSGGEDLSGAVEIDGSSTVFPITEAVAEEYRNEQGGVQVTVGVSGTGGGFERFCAGETDVSDASRPIKAEEAEICAAAGIEFIEIPVAYDGLSVVVNPANDWVTCITVEELNTIWDATSDGQITKWNQVNPTWPDTDLVLYGPGTDSGTFDYFVEVITESEDSRSDYTPSEDDNVLVQGVAGTENALGYFGLAYLEENLGTIKGLEVDGGNGCVAPTAETVESGEYAPLSRPLFIYVKVESAETKPQVEDFINFYLENAATLSADVGYVQFPQEFYDVVGERWESRTAGSIFSGASGSVGEILGVN
jgi:phosphate transport system substrate-binding protein